MAFGSCSKHDHAQPLWEAIVGAEPQVWAWLGDNVYVDKKVKPGSQRFEWLGEQAMRQAYQEQLAHAGYAALRARALHRNHTDAILAKMNGGQENAAAQPGARPGAASASCWNQFSRGAARAARGVSSPARLSVTHGRRPGPGGEAPSRTRNALATG